MMTLYRGLPFSRVLCALVLCTVSALAAPLAAQAAEQLVTVNKKPPKGGRPTGEYLDRLLDEINARRAEAGSPPLVYVASGANEAVNAYLADLTPELESIGACYHGSYNPTAPAWDYVAAAGVDAPPRGEVLACPDESGYWTADHTADSWWGSPIHFDELYADADANALACGTYGPQRDGEAYVTIACVTYQL